MPSKQDRYDKYFMEVAKVTSQNSYARRTKVGCVIVKDGRIISTGWNGTAKGQDNNCEDELPDGSLVTKSNVIHAEANAISFCAKYGISTNEASLYITLSPCVNCALLLLQAGISSVYYHETYRNTDGIKLLEKSGVKVKQI